jgi:hypothetical protein
VARYRAQAARRCIALCGRWRIRDLVPNAHRSEQEQHGSGATASDIMTGALAGLLGFEYLTLQNLLPAAASAASWRARTINFWPMTTLDTRSPAHRRNRM